MNTSAMGLVYVRLPVRSITARGEPVCREQLSRAKGGNRRGGAQDRHSHRLHPCEGSVGSTCASCAPWGGLATALTCLDGSAAMVAASQEWLSWLALAGVVGTAVMAYALNREDLRRDRANAGRYEENAVALTCCRHGSTRWQAKSPPGAQRR